MLLETIGEGIMSFCEHKQSDESIPPELEMRDMRDEPEFHDLLMLYRHTGHFDVTRVLEIETRIKRFVREHFIPV